MNALGWIVAAVAVVSWILWAVNRHYERLIYHPDMKIRPIMWSILAAVLIGLSGCATMPDGVLLVSEEHVAGCKPLGMVSNDALHDMTMANATADMLQSAKRLGADAVVVTTKPAAKMLEISMVGTAYRCNWSGASLDPTADIEDPNSDYIEPTYDYTGIEDCETSLDPECDVIQPEPICEDGYVYGDKGCVKE